MIVYFLLLFLYLRIDCMLVKFDSFGTETLGISMEDEFRSSTLPIVKCPSVKTLQVSRHDRFQLLVRFESHDNQTTLNQCWIDSVVILFQSLHITLMRGDSQKSRNGDHRFENVICFWNGLCIFFL